jgi:ParB-like chromosome segregation protein Spo0J
MIDGGHRIKALIDLGQKYVSAEVYEGLTDRQIYQMSVEANASHGKPFENAELRNIVRKLDKEFRMSREDISKIVRIPIDKIDGFIVKEIIRDNPMEPSLARQPAYQHAGINIDVQKVRKVDDNNYKPKRFENDYVRNQQEETKAQLRIIESLIALLKTNAISKRDETINFQLQKLYELLTKRFENEAK